MPMPWILGALLRVLGPLARPLGTAVEGSVRRRHLQRLRRTGHLAPGAGVDDLPPGGFGVREGNSVELLVDGQQAFATMAAAIAGARRSVSLTAWSRSSGAWTPPTCGPTAGTRPATRPAAGTAGTTRPCA